MDIAWSGTAKKLTGNCLTVGIFVSGEQEGEWDATEKEETWAKVESSMAWIVEKAKEYEVEVNIESICLNLDSDATVAELSNEGTTSGATEMAHSVATQVGYENAKDMFDRLAEDYPDYNIHVLFIFNYENIAHHENIHVGEGSEIVDICVVCKEIDHNEVLAATIIHESLHSFGAIDLYGKGERPEDIKAAEFALKKFPKDIMICATNDMDELEINELTAFYLGWHGAPKPWYTKVVSPYSVSDLKYLMNNHIHYDENGNLVIEEEEELLKYSYDGGEFTRNKLNNDDNLIIWRQVETDSDEIIEFWEANSEGEFYRLDGITDKYEVFEMPKDTGGMSFILNEYEEPATRDEWYEMSLVE